jgi:hypothetical protein
MGRQRRLSPGLERAFARARRYSRTHRAVVSEEYLAMIREVEAHAANLDGADKSWVLAAEKQWDAYFARARRRH